MSMSAGKMRGSVGVESFAATKVYIPGEGWVRWSTIKAQVAQAYEQWRIRRAMAGKKTWDGAEAAQANIDEALARRLKISQEAAPSAQRPTSAAGRVRK